VKSEKQSNLRENLKILTKEMHDKLENSPELSFLHNNEICIQNYYQLITKMHQFFNVLEPLIKQYENHFIKHGLGDIKKRFQRVQWLLDDLKEAEIEIPKTKEISFKTLNNFDSVVGALYVCEGSTMGGVQITKILSKKLGISYPFHFYKGYKDDTMAMWGDFCHWIDTIDINSTDVILGASEIYLRLGESLEKKR
jgi:heme oxygenase